MKLILELLKFDFQPQIFAVLSENTSLYFKIPSALEINDSTHPTIYLPQNSWSKKKIYRFTTKNFTLFKFSILNEKSRNLKRSKSPCDIRVAGRPLKQKVATLRSSWNQFKKEDWSLKNILGYLSYKKWRLRLTSGFKVGNRVVKIQKSDSSRFCFFIFLFDSQYPN